MVPAVGLSHTLKTLNENTHGSNIVISQLIEWQERIDHNTKINQESSDILNGAIYGALGVPLVWGSIYLLSGGPS